ncbi:MAG: hypothetical protein A2172_00765 [Candidatus Woykebacteria bacterium RBG_13_40_15]|uniref:Uncharacterized protein n=1 Tax=Candidatus Woykebacteria bacterium RBG_13_40_15 TaxID=1802593 RepID=A0A1G1W8S6_9BACT|nr:MAG: hypothetical protein A2172_00765 [Candidatus Woykebacteria bacterium RBG_13_40_15]
MPKVKKRLILFSLSLFSLIFLISPSNKNALVTKTYGDDPAKLCSLKLTGDGEIDGVPYVLPGGTLRIQLTGAKPKLNGFKNPGDVMEFRREGDPYNAKSKIRLPISTDGDGDGNGEWEGNPERYFGTYTTNYDKYSIFPDCPNGVSPNDKTFYMFREHEYNGKKSGLAWLITPHDPPKNDDTRISIFIAGVEKLYAMVPNKCPDGSKCDLTRWHEFLEKHENFKAFMVKVYGDGENGSQEPGFTGSFISQSGGSLYALDDGDGDICDSNPHQAYKADLDAWDLINKKKTEEEKKEQEQLLNKLYKCADADHWGKNDFLRPRLPNEMLEKLQEESPDANIGPKLLEIKGICENMQGIRSSCDDAFNENVAYKFAIYGVLVPPIKGTEKIADDGKGDIADMPSDGRDLSSKDYDACDDSTDGLPTYAVGEDEETIARLVDVDTCDVYGPLKAENSVKAIFTFTPVKADSAMGYFEGEGYINTPFGKIPVSAAGIAQAILSLALGAGGGIAFLLMVFGSYRLIFSAGNPMAVQQGREVITAAVVGLLVILFSVFILRLFGIGVLGLPIG